MAAATRAGFRVNPIQPENAVQRRAGHGLPVGVVVMLRSGTLMSLFAASVFLAASAVARSTNYCALCADHTMCIYRCSGARCRNLHSRDLTRVERQEALAAHNVLRSKVAAGDEPRGRAGQKQPPAANMRALVRRWDKELATIARHWAMQCSAEQDTCRTSADGTRVGQNIHVERIRRGLRQPSKVSVPLAVWEWYNEVDAFDGRRAALPYEHNASTAHYTMMVWARTTRVGCGFADFTESDGSPVRLIVCNYKQAGNVVGSDMYLPGVPASHCPDNSTGRPKQDEPEPPEDEESSTQGSAPICPCASPPPTTAESPPDAPSTAESAPAEASTEEPPASAPPETETPTVEPSKPAAPTSPTKPPHRPTALPTAHPYPYPYPIPPWPPSPYPPPPPPGVYLPPIILPPIPMPQYPPPPGYYPPGYYPPGYYPPPPHYPPQYPTNGPHHAAWYHALCA